MRNNSRFALALSGLALAALVLSGCAGAGSGPSSGGGHIKGAPSWCGPKRGNLAYLDGFGGNSWRLVAQFGVKQEVAKCPNITSYSYSDAQGDTQRAISDIQGSVAKGVSGIIVFPDAGRALLPALRSAYQAGLVVVPFRVTPGGKAGVDYTQGVIANMASDATHWADFIKSQFPKGAHILQLSGPAGNSEGTTIRATLEKELPASKYTFVGDDPFEVTNWDPATTQQVLSAAIAKYPDIDVIAADFGPSLVGALPAFKAQGKSIPAIVTSDGNALGCFYQDNKADNPDFKLFTVSIGVDNARLAAQVAIAHITGGKVPTETSYAAPVFENSVTGSPHLPQCRADLPGDIYLSSQTSPEDQARLFK